MVGTRGDFMRAFGAIRSPDGPLGNEGRSTRSKGPRGVMEGPRSVILMSNNVEQMPAYEFGPLGTNVDRVCR